MNWFPGNIAEAVNLSKSRNAIFVVYCEGADEMSKILSTIINNERISSKLSSDLFVAIKVLADSESYKQFVQIYKLVPIPSLFFIGKNGTPLEVVTGITKTVEELEFKIAAVLERAGLSSGTEPAIGSSSTSPVPEAAGAAAPTPTAGSSNPDDDTEVVCEDGVCFKRPKEHSAPSDTPADSVESAQAQLVQEEKLRRAKELIEKKRLEKEEENARLERERELNRRRAGQDLQNFKQRQEETELKKQQEERRREKIELQAARQRILAQIAQDKAERAAKFNNEPLPKPTAEKKDDAQFSFASAVDKTEARIQFKKPDGESEVKVFKSTEKFEAIRLFVEENVIVGSGIREFALATTFPKREFKKDDDSKTLLELNLAPTSVLLVLPLDKVVKKSLPLQTGGGAINAVTALFWGILNTMFGTFTSSKNFIIAKFNNIRGNGTGAQKRQGEDELSPNDAAKRRNLRAFDTQPTAGPSNATKQSNAYKRVGSSNVHKLSDIRDDDDDNNTWNGNSTQQQ